MGKELDITGMKFGRLTVIEKAPKIKGRRRQWLCKCDCGNYTKAEARHLRNGSRVSCGCARKTHGMSDTRLHTIWNSMRCRCERKQTNGYERYGGRGITVCDVWKKFEPFMEWALSHGYSDDLFLDRIDNDKGYFPENCRWVTFEEQCNNQRTNIKITCDGETHTLAQWSRITGLSAETIRKRLRSGMTPSDAIYTENRVAKRPVKSIDPKTKEVTVFDSASDAERAGYDRAAIWRVITGEYKTHKGLIWQYAN